MKRIPFLTAFLAVGMASAAQGSLVIFDNTVTSSNFGYVAQDSGGRIVPSIDDLHVVGGGQLESLTFTMIGQSLGGPVDAHIVLAIDNGDGIPDYVLGGGGTDSVIFEKTLPGITGPLPFIPTGFAVPVDVDVLADNVVIPANATVFAQVGFTRGGFSADVDQVFHGSVAVGSTDPLVYKYGSSGIESDVAPGGGVFDGLGWKLTVVPEPATLCLLGLGGIALLRRRRV